MKRSSSLARKRRTLIFKSDCKKGLNFYAFEVLYLRSTDKNTTLAIAKNVNLDMLD